MLACTLIRSSSIYVYDRISSDMTLDMLNRKEALALEHEVVSSQEAKYGCAVMS